MNPQRVTLSVSKCAFALIALALAACQGSFGSGGTSAPGGVNPPVASPGNNALPETLKPKPSGSPTTPPGNEVTYPVSDAPDGLKCPQDQGFSCTLQFSVVTPSPSPSPSGSASASPTPSPTPTPTPTPTATPFGATQLFTPTPTSSPTPLSSGAHITLRIAGLPKDAPKMNNPDPKAVATVALVSLRLRTDADVTINGKVIADYTLPKEQIGGRGFAVQLYHEDVKKHKTSDAFFGSYSKSKLDGTTLHFEIDAPALAIKKNETWLLVLYGDELPSASTSPSPSASGSASASPSTSPSASPSGSPSASASGSPSPAPA